MAAFRGPKHGGVNPATGLPVQPIVVRSASGRTIGPKETRSSQGKGDRKILQDMEPSRLSTVQKMKVDLENPDSTGHGDIFSEVQHPFLKQAAMRDKARRSKGSASIQLAPPGGG